jgi:hypothetical protein
VTVSSHFSVISSPGVVRAVNLPGILFPRHSDSDVAAPYKVRINLNWRCRIRTGDRGDDVAAAFN